MHLKLRFLTRLSRAGPCHRWEVSLCGLAPSALVSGSFIRVSSWRDSAWGSLEISSESPYTGSLSSASLESRNRNRLQAPRRLNYIYLCSIVIQLLICRGTGQRVCSPRCTPATRMAFLLPTITWSPRPSLSPKSLPRISSASPPEASVGATSQHLHLWVVPKSVEVDRIWPSGMEWAC